MGLQCEDLRPFDVLCHQLHTVHVYLPYEWFDGTKQAFLGHPLELYGTVVDILH